MRKAARRHDYETREARQTTGNSAVIPSVRSSDQQIRVIFQDFGLNEDTCPEYGFTSTAIWDPEEDNDMCIDSRYYLFIFLIL